MAEDERYAEQLHGLFPRFLLAGLCFASVGVLLQPVVEALVPLPGPFPSSGSALTLEIWNVISVAYFPFAAFVLFYLSSGVRIDIGKDFGRVAASIFLGALVVLLLYGVPEALEGNLGTGAVYTLVWSTADAVYESIGYAFVGFTAILISYRRRA